MTKEEQDKFRQAIKNRIRDKMCQIQILDCKLAEAHAYVEALKDALDLIPEPCPPFDIREGIPKEK